jgi:hypothetical protein
MTLTNNPIFKNLVDLNMPTNDFALFGSGPMFAHGLKELGHDIDVIARGEAWQEATKFATPQPTKSGNGEVVELFGGEIEIFSAWGPGEWDIDELIDMAEIIEGIRFVRLEQVLRWKQQMNRPKDVEHIKLIENYLANHKN